MGVRCTLLGHSYGEPEIEREREERGEEAVVTIREVETCSRCGDRSIVSENKEVTAAGTTGADVAGPDDADAAPTSEPRPTEPDSGDPVAAETVDEKHLDAEPEGRDTGEAGNGGEEPTDAAADESTEGPEHDPETDDGVILEDDPDAEPEEREYGAWPDADDDHASAEGDPTASAADDPEPWPDSEEDADEGYDAAPPEGEPADVEYPGSADADPATTNEPEDADEPADVEDSSAAGASAEAEPPADAEASTEDAELLDGPDGTEFGEADEEAETKPADEGAEFERAQETGSPSTPSTDGTVLYCPACGYRDPSRDGSLREGDICPECRKGYLAAGE